MLHHFEECVVNFDTKSRARFDKQSLSFTDVFLPDRFPLACYKHFSNNRLLCKTGSVCFGSEMAQMVFQAGSTGHVVAVPLQNLSES